MSRRTIAADEKLAAGSRPMRGAAPRWRWALVFVALAIGACLAPRAVRAETLSAEEAASGAAAGVEEGKEALGSRWRYPWYDESGDGVRRVPVKVPWRAPDAKFNSSWGGGGWNFSVLELFVWTFALILFAVLVYLLIHAYLHREDVGAAAPVGASERAAVDDATRIEALPFRVRRGPLTLLEEARRYYELGDLKQAIIYLFSYQLVEMDKQQIIRLTKGKTNRQYMREIRRPGALRGLVEQTMVAFEDVFFGDHFLEPARFESCWRRLDEFESLIGERAT